MPYTNEITTNGHVRELLTLAEVPAAARDDFDYIEGDDAHSPRLFAYRGEFYDVNEFTLTELPDWDGIQHDSFWTAIVVRYAEDTEHVVVGRLVVTG